MVDPLSITASVLSLLGVVLKVSVTAMAMVDKTTAAHQSARDALRNLRRALQNLNKETSNIQAILRILISDPKDEAVKKLLALPDGGVAVKELCESLESTRDLLAERASQAQLETRELDPLPENQMSLAFVQAVFKHNLSPSHIEDAITALKNFQFEVESCQQTTGFAFQQVWRVYEIAKSRILQRRSSVSTISSISTQIPESSTSPRATIIDWLKRQDAASKANSGTPNLATQTGGDNRAGTSAEENSPALENQPIPMSGAEEWDRGKEAQKEVTRMIGFLIATASDDWALTLELCECASSSESAAKEAAKALKQEFKYAEPPAQLSAARLWAIMLQNASDSFIIQTATKKFMKTVESVILSPATSPVVRERFIDVLAAAAFTFHGPGKEEFQSTWRRVRPLNKPEDGIPFNMDDLMFDPTQGYRSRAVTSPVPPVTDVNAPPSPQSHRPDMRLQDSDQGHGGRERGHLREPSRKADGRLILSEDDTRIFEECEVALYSTRILFEALAYSTPRFFSRNPVIKEYYAKCQASHHIITAQIQSAYTGAAHSQAGREEGPNNPNMAKEEKLLAALLNANQELVDVFKCYQDLEVAENAEEEKRGHNRGREGHRSEQIQYIPPDGSPIPDPAQSNSAFAPPREPSPSRGVGRPSKSREFPSPSSTYATPTQPYYGHRHSRNGTGVNNFTPPLAAPHGPSLTASHPQSRARSSGRQTVFPPVGAINAAAAVGGHRDLELREPSRGLISPEEDMRKLFEECEVALYSSRILNEALAYSTPDFFSRNPVIKEYYAKCQASHHIITAQIQLAYTGAARSQAGREEGPNNPNMSKEEKLLAALLNANQELVDVFKCYHESEGAANAFAIAHTFS